MQIDNPSRHGRATLPRSKVWREPHPPAEQSSAGVSPSHLNGYSETSFIVIPKHNAHLILGSQSEPNWFILIVVGVRAFIAQPISPI